MAGRTLVRLYASLVLMVFDQWMRTAAAEKCTLLAEECTCATVNNYNFITEVHEQFCVEPKYMINSTQVPQFTAQPESGVYHNQTTGVHLDCNITTVSGYSAVFVWEFNGTAVSDASPYMIRNIGATSSRLLLPKFSGQVQGEYRCRVTSGNRNYTLLSQTAKLELPEFHGWIDQAYPPQPNNNNLALRAPGGSSVILECHPNTTEPVVPKPQWLRNNTYLNLTSAENHFLLPDGSLLVRNVNFSRSGKLLYKCILSLPSDEKSREFVISMDKDVPPPSAVPTNQIVAYNSSVSLYCITGSTPSSNTWLKDGMPLTKVSSITPVHPVRRSPGDTSVTYIGEVLVIERVSMETGGKYTCVTADGQRLDAHVTVVAPPTRATISITGGGSYIYASTAYVPLTGETAILTLTCSTDGSSVDPTVQYSWVFRGSQIKHNSSIYLEDHNTLVITSTNIWDAIGTYQCSAANEAGAVTTNILLLPDGKLNPPTGLTIPRPTYPYAYLYNLSWYPPLIQTIGNSSLTSYTVEVLVYRSGGNQRCVCKTRGKDYTMLQFLANEYVKDSFYFRVAANTDRGQSDFVPYSCSGEYVELVTPPNPEPNDDVRYTKNPDGNLWIVTLYWGTAGCRGDLQECNCQYPSSLIFQTTVQVHCDGMEVITENYSRRTATSTVVTVPCCTMCSWSVEYSLINSDVPSSRANSSFTTAALAPAGPATLISVNRTGSDGKSITVVFTLPANNISCNPTLIRVNYTNSTFSGVATKQLDGYNPATRRYNIGGVELTRAQCWAQYNISISYDNAAGREDAWSNTLTLRGPIDSDIKGFENISVERTTSNSITVQWQLLPGTACLIAAGFLSGKICYHKQKEGDEKCHVTNDPCRQITEEDLQDSTTGFQNVESYTKYCVIAYVTLSSHNDSNTIINCTSTTAVTKQDKPSSKPLNVDCWIRKNQIQVIWDPPPEQDKNGILTHYQVNATSSGTLPQNRTVRPGSDSGERATNLSYNAAFQYVISVSACTVIGCGPPATCTAPESTNGAPTDTPGGGGGGNSSQVNILVPVVAVVVVLALVVIVAIVAIKRCNQCRKHSEQYRHRLFDNESIRDEPLVDDVVSVGRPAPSVHSEHTEYDLLQRHLKDRDQLEQYWPDGSADGYRIKEEEGRPDGTGSTECLLDTSSTSSTRGKATALNCQAKLKGNGATVEGVEMEAVAAASGDCSQQDSMGRDQGGGLEETKPQFCSPRTITVLGGELEACKPKPPKAVKRESQHANGRKAHTSKKSKRKKESCMNAHTGGTPLVPVNPAIPPLAVPPIGYVGSPGGGAVASHNDPAQTTHLTSILTGASSELADNMRQNPPLSTPYQQHCSSQRSALESSHDPLKPRDLSINSESMLPFSVPSNLLRQQNQFRKPTPGYIQDESIINTWKTQDNIGTAYSEGPPVATMPASNPPKISLEAIVEPLPAIQAELRNSIPSPPATSELPIPALISLDPQSQKPPTSSITTAQQQHDGSYQFIQGTTSDVPPSVPRSNPEFDLGELAEEYDDSASDTSSHNSVFEDLDTHKNHGGYIPWPQSLRTQQKTRSQLTSGVSSQSESTEPDSGRLMRMLSEGYHSGPNTPVGKEPTDFSLCKPSQDSTSGNSETLPSYTPGTETHSTEHSSSDISETLLLDAPGTETHSNSSGYITSPSTENRNNFSFGPATDSQAQHPCKDSVTSSGYVSSPPAVFPVAQQLLQKPSDDCHLPQGKTANQICSIKTWGNFSLPTPTHESPKPRSVKSPPSSPSMVTLQLSGSHNPSYVSSSTEPKSTRVPLTSKLPNQYEAESQVGNTDQENVPRSPVPLLSGSSTYMLPSLLGATKPVFGAQTTHVPLAPEMAVDSQFGNKLFDSERTSHTKPCTDVELHVSDKSYTPHGELETTLNLQNYMNTANIDMDKIGFDPEQLSYIA